MHHLASSSSASVIDRSGEQMRLESSLTPS
jgi:hypothetical protein